MESVVIIALTRTNNKQTNSPTSKIIESERVFRHKIGLGIGYKPSEVFFIVNWQIEIEIEMVKIDKDREKG